MVITVGAAFGFDRENTYSSERASAIGQFLIFGFAVP
jgi:hypothetical protein